MFLKLKQEQKSGISKRFYKNWLQGWIDLNISECRFFDFKYKIR